MKVDTQILESHEAKILVEAESAELMDAKQKAARKIARRVKIPGFRPGKAPYNVIERQVGEATIIEDAVEMLAQDLYPRAIEDAGIKPYGPGTLENIVSIDPPQFEFLVPLQAEVKLGDYQAVREPYSSPEVSGDDIDRAIDQMRERFAVVEPVERAAAVGDVVRVHLSGTRNHPGDGEDNVLVNERTLPVIVEEEDADTTHEWPYPGFSRELLGLSSGDEKKLIYTFTEDSPYETLRGVEASFDVNVEQVSSRSLPELDDEFARTASEHGTLADLRIEIQKELEANAKNQYHQDYDEKVLNQIIEQSTLKYPAQMVDRELDDMLHDLGHRLEQQGLDLEMYLKMNQKSEDELREDMRSSAEERLKRSLVLFELSRAENIAVDEADVQSETINTLNMLSRSLPENEMRKLAGSNQIQNLVSNIMADMLVRKTIEHIRGIASDGLSIETALPATAEEPVSAEQSEVATSLENQTVETPDDENIGETVADIIPENSADENEETTTTDPSGS